jgi:kinesin family protein 5
MQFALFRWRGGEKVSAEDQLNLAEMEESISAVPSVAANLDKPTAQLHLVSSHISMEDRKNIEEQTERLYQLLDSKVFQTLRAKIAHLLMEYYGNQQDDEIQEQSQLVEKLKEQMLEQEELIANTRRDYENLTKEMTKIQVLALTRIHLICFAIDPSIGRIGRE